MPACLQHMQPCSCQSPLLCEPTICHDVHCRHFAATGYYIKAMFLTVAPAYSDYVATFGKAAEYVATAVQWHPAMR